jgi:hypothetical protein
MKEKEMEKYQNIIQNQFLNNNNINNSINLNNSKPITPFNPKNYIPFEELTNFPENEDYIEIIKIISNLIKISENWNNNMEALNILRRLNKFNKTLFNTIFDAHFRYISSAFLNSPRSCIVKLSLILISEIFSNNKIITHLKFPDWVDTLIPVVVKKNVLDKNFIQEEAKNSLIKFTKNIHTSEGLLIFLKIIQDKNLKYSSKAYELFLDITQEICEEKLKNSKGIKWECIFKELIEISKIKKDPYPKRFKNLLLVLYKKLGVDTIEKLLNDMLNLVDYFYFTKTDMISLSEFFHKIIQEEIKNETSKKTKELISLQEHVKSLKNSEKNDKEKLETIVNDNNKCNILDEILILEAKRISLKEENDKEILNFSKVEIPQLILTSAKKSIDNLEEEKNEKENDKKNTNIYNDNDNIPIEIVLKREFTKIDNKNEDENETIPQKLEINIKENPLKNKVLEKLENIIGTSNSKIYQKSIKKNNSYENKNENEERPKDSIEVEPLSSLIKKSKNQENIIN